VPPSTTSESDRLSTRTKWAILFGGGLILLIVLALAAEFAIRYRQARIHGTAATIEKFYTVDERIGLRVPIANLTLGHVSTNSLGFRGPEIAVPKPEGTTRVAFLGASTTWCAEVTGNDKVWAHLVAEGLREAFPRAKIDYVNGAAPGYVVRSSIKNLEHRVAPLQPDVIVIYHATNDMSAELRQLAQLHGFTSDGASASPSWFARHSLLWDLAEKNLRIWAAKRRAQASVGHLSVDVATLGSGFRNDLETLVRAAQQHSGVVALATFSTRLRAGQSTDQQLSASASALYYMPFMTPSGLIASYARYNEVIRDVAASTGAILIDGEHTIPGDAEHFSDSVHFTDAGSRAMADRVLRALTEDHSVRKVFQQ